MVRSRQQPNQTPTHARVCRESRETLSIVWVSAGLTLTQDRDFTVQLILQAPSFPPTRWMSHVVESPPAVLCGSMDSVSRARMQKRLDIR